MYLEFISQLGYLIGSVCFVWGLKLLSSPDTARRGNIIAAVGMAAAIIAILLAPMERGDNNFALIAGGLVLGGGLGLFMAYKVKMTGMPQMVSILNGLGGASAVVIATVEMSHYYDGSRPMSDSQLLIPLATLLIGGIAFTGSLLAWWKLEEWINDNALTLPKHNIFNLLLLAVIVALGVWLFIQGPEASFGLAMLFMGLSLLYGFSFVIPIGGADMPVVISLLNSFSGLSAAAAGLIYGNNFMLVGGILVGASGTILTLLMCNAMNRSLLNVLVGGFGGSSGPAKAQQGDLVIREVSLNDAAIQLFYSQSVVFVPGYGLAVAQAQKVVKEVDEILEKNGVDVKYAIHPVAGRMPGHMNVLLAEADVPYPKLLDLEEANDFIANADVAVIIGANDVVNPAAEDDPSSPIYGMPVLQVWKAKHVIVLKRSMRAGYAGIDNMLFFHPRNKMLFGDAKDTLGKLVGELKGL
ncbi:MAG TPA: NAD(P)(+) transhydrogenase (Re/Si-specific) subunit beta [Saprospiraceae bacterium]|jgi:NAD(P) transhydrogenase subunit beta|nr:NAD(P)(+) transhydrogenase (Re/Si-specific) subunit beta [Saprospiraceae bacterium]HRK81278.1 NAD(P)(+) transhydrogenase (Re/Si-specific) subunit beta [Saprospiraceae bacterium]